MSAMSPSVHLIINKIDTLSLCLSAGWLCNKFTNVSCIRIAFARCTCNDLRHFFVHIWSSSSSTFKMHAVRHTLNCIYVCDVDTFNSQPSALVASRREHRTSSPSVFVCLRKFIYWHTTNALIAKIIIIMAMSSRYSERKTLTPNDNIHLHGAGTPTNRVLLHMNQSALRMCFAHHQHFVYIVWALSCTQKNCSDSFHALPFVWVFRRK